MKMVEEEREYDGERVGEEREALKGKVIGKKIKIEKYNNHVYSRDYCSKMYMKEK